MKNRYDESYGIDRSVNYQRELDRFLQDLTEVPSLLLHSCCGPCSSYCLAYLSQYFAITVFYYNPNIYPSAEYEQRIAEQKAIIDHTRAKHPITFLEGRYDPRSYYQAVSGHENDAEGGERCHICYRIRLREAARVAAELGMMYLTTSLTISPKKDAHILNAIGRQEAQAVGVTYLNTDFKKRGGFQASVAITKELGIYRQDYCGCRFSMRKSDEYNGNN